MPVPPWPWIHRQDPKPKKTRTPPATWGLSPQEFREWTDRMNAPDPVPLPPRGTPPSLFRAILRSKEDKCKSP